MWTQTQRDFQICISVPLTWPCASHLTDLLSPNMCCKIIRYWIVLLMIRFDYFYMTFEEQTEKISVWWSLRDSEARSKSNLFGTITKFLLNYSEGYI